MIFLTSESEKLAYQDWLRDLEEEGKGTGFSAEEQAALEESLRIAESVHRREMYDFRTIQEEGSSRLLFRKTREDDGHGLFV